MNLKPLHDRVLVERVSSEDKTKAVSLFLIQLKKSQWKVKSLQLVAVLEITVSCCFRCKKVTEYFLVNGLVLIKIDGKELLIMKDLHHGNY